MKTISHFLLSVFFITTISCQKEKDIIAVQPAADSVLPEQECGDRAATVTPRFDNIAFCFTPPACSFPNYFTWNEFNALNWHSSNGHFIAMHKDNYRNDIHAQENKLAGWIDDLNDGSSYMSAVQKADDIESQILHQFTNTGDHVKTKWIILNELSRSLWISNSNNYRTWLVNVVKRLKNTYNHEVIVCSPIEFAGNYPSQQWQQLSLYGYIAIEGYLSGKAIKANDGGHGLNTPAGMAAAKSWCYQKYLGFKQSYNNQGVPFSKIYLIEHFAQTKENQMGDDGNIINYGRCGVSVANWKLAIKARGEASGNVGFAGFVSYAWHRNWMNASESDLVSFINAYKATSPF